MNLNQVILVGRLGKDPELKTTPSGQSVAKFSLATSERWKDKDGKQVDHTEWHNVVVWGSTAENAAKFLKKGSEALVSGKLTNRSYSDKSGVTKYITEIVASSVQFGFEKKIDKPESATSVPAPMQTAPAKTIAPVLFTEEDLPF